MFFNGFDFLVFFCVVFVAQMLLPHRPRNLFLLGASYFFYGCWDWRFLGLMAVSTVIDFVCSRAIASSVNDGARRLLLTLSIIANLSILGYFKYAGFFVDSWILFAESLGLHLQSRSWEIILPVGISFYTFQTLSYTWDVYRGEMKPLDSFWDFALYVAFFPQLVAGPIERGASLAPQIASGPRTTLAGFQSGGWLVFKGLFKKAVIADNLAPLVDQAFSLDQPSTVQVLIGTYAFAFQIYGDFSGYTDIARGIGRMLGYDLSLNFRLPYLATNPSEFWQRWHISLSSWLRDYLYIPLGGNRGAALATYRNLFLTMLLGGLWHGAAWTFVIWGLFHALLLIVHRRLTSCAPWSESWIRRSYGIRVLVMFHLTCLGWLIFRAESIENLRSMLIGLTHWSAISVADWQNIWLLVMLAGPLVVLHMIKEHLRNLNVIPNLSLVPRLTIYTAMAVALLAFGSFGQKEFIYFQF